MFTLKEIQGPSRGSWYAKTGATMQQPSPDKRQLQLSTNTLDAIEHKQTEEMSGMNFMAIETQPITPSLTDTILAGITRDSSLNLRQA